MLNSPMLSIFQHFHAIPLRSPLISLRSKWRLTGFSRRFTPKNPVRLHKPFGQLPRWGAKNVLPLNLIALPCGAVYPPPSARPFFKGLLSCHGKAPLVKTTKREYPCIVISSGARNPPCTPVKQRAWDDDKRNTLGDASVNDTKKTLLSHHFSSPALNPSSLYAKIELSLISLLIKSIAGIGFS